MPRPHHFIGSDAVQQGARHGLNTDQLPAKFPAHQYSIFLRGIVKILPDAILHKPLLFIEGACRRVALPHIQKYFIDFSFFTYIFQFQHQMAACPLPPGFFLHCNADNLRFSRSLVNQHISYKPSLPFLLLYRLSAVD